MNNQIEGKRASSKLSNVGFRLHKEANMLVKCLTCGTEVATTAKACPKCGAPQAGSAPDQLLRNLLIAIAAIILVGFAYQFYVGYQSQRGAELSPIFGDVKIP
jgi:uncharacterized paraquat-inducible protein A